MRVLRWIGKGLALLALGAGLAWQAGVAPPFGPIAGGRLSGEVAPALPEDWSFVDRVAEVQVETRLGPLRWSVTTWCLSHAGRLYVPARNCLAKRWVKNVLRDPDVRVRIEGRLYPLRARRNDDPAIAQALLEQMLEKYLGVQAVSPQAVAGEAAGRAYGCAFAMEPRR
jgi:hypothetical protein